MDIRRGISFIAFGSLFTLVNLNLDFGFGPVSVTPDFIGWVFYYLAYSQLGSYTDRKPILKILPFVQILLTGANWLLGFTTGYETASSVLGVVSGFISAYYMYKLFEVLIVIARNYNSPRKGTLELLRVANAALYVVLASIGLLISLSDNPVPYAMIFTMIGVIGEVAAIWTSIILFGMRGDIRSI